MRIPGEMHRGTRSVIEARVSTHLIAVSEFPSRLRDGRVPKFLDKSADPGRTVAGNVTPRQTAETLPRIDDCHASQSM